MPAKTVINQLCLYRCNFKHFYIFLCTRTGVPVSYTHLDVYKRQGLPSGICGSGVIDALACLLEIDALDETGLLETAPASIAPPVELTQRDVRMVQLAKSAVSAGLRTLMHTVNISCSDVAELAVAGGFGSYLNPANAGRIGLIPEELVPKVRILGNAALSLSLIHI